MSRNVCRVACSFRQLLTLSTPGSPSELCSQRTRHQTVTTRDLFRTDNNIIEQRQRFRFKMFCCQTGWLKQGGSRKAPAVAGHPMELHGGAGVHRVLPAISRIPRFLSFKAPSRSPTSLWGIARNPLSQMRGFQINIRGKGSFHLAEKLDVECVSLSEAMSALLGQPLPLRNFQNIPSKAPDP